MNRGLGNYIETEAIPGALVQDQNSPQHVPMGLIAEQLTGSAFTAPRRTGNLKSWLYRIRPSVLHATQFRPLTGHLFESTVQTRPATPPTQMRWDPLPVPSDKTDFVAGIVTMAVNGDVLSQQGAAIHLYAANTDMGDHYFYNADGELLIVPQLGGLSFRTELGHFTVQPGSIAVIPRGVKFQVDLLDDQARGYICENYGAVFQLPERGPIGANGLAEERHFEVPEAAYEARSGDFRLTAKFGGRLWVSDITHSPLDVVAWHGNYYPCRYDLALFNPVWSVGVDHSDPSIFTVLTAPTSRPGVANIDFVIFPERWMVVERSFRPPYYHRNIMSEFMGLIHGDYDAKEGGFVPGGSSLHNCMSGHGVDARTYEKAVAEDLKPHKYDPTLAFMFESSLLWQLTDFALQTPLNQADYVDCWQDIPVSFRGA